MDQMSDRQLWAIVRQRLTEDERARLDALTFRCEREDATPGDQAELEVLLAQVDDLMLRRSHALLALKSRGVDVERALRSGE